MADLGFNNFSDPRTGQQRAAYNRRGKPKEAPVKNPHASIQGYGSVTILQRDTTNEEPRNEVSPFEASRIVGYNRGSPRSSRSPWPGSDVVEKKPSASSRKALNKSNANSPMVVRICIEDALAYESLEFEADGTCKTVGTLTLTRGEELQFKGTVPVLGFDDAPSPMFFIIAGSSTVQTDIFIPYWQKSYQLHVHDDKENSVNGETPLEPQDLKEFKNLGIVQDATYIKDTKRTPKYKWVCTVDRIYCLK